MSLSGMKWFVMMLFVGLCFYFTLGGVEWEVIASFSQEMAFEVIPEAIDVVVSHVI